MNERIKELAEQRWASFYAQEALSLKAALREAKSALSDAVAGMGGSYAIWKPTADAAIATINKVLGEE